MGKRADTGPTKWRRLPWVTFRGTHRNYRWLRVTIVLALIVSAFHSLHKFQTYRTSLAIKYSPTTFTGLTLEEQTALESPRWQWAPGEDFGTTYGYSESYSRQTLLEDQSTWKQLGRGFEGETFRHGDNVVKVYRRENAPFRNCVPEWKPDLRWPTEISASVILGGLADSDGVPGDAAFLPVVDYFLSPPEKHAKSKWHFVTPFLANGNLVKLSERLRESTAKYTARDLDAIFRPSLDNLLQTLDTMHSRYDLCHDDLKVDNIFLGPRGTSPNQTTQWLLGDLGNVREREHPYHTSLMWTALKMNLPDCRANDVSRLMKAYMEFLRTSVDDARLFNQELFEASQPWSRLFWFVSDAVHRGENLSAILTLEQSSMGDSPISEPMGGIGRQPSEMRNPLYRLFLGKEWILARTTKSALRVRASENVARIWGLVPLLGVPYSACHVETG